MSNGCHHSTPPNQDSLEPPLPGVETTTSHLQLVAPTDKDGAIIYKSVIGNVPSRSIKMGKQSYVDDVNGH